MKSKINLTVTLFLIILTSFNVSNVFCMKPELANYWRDMLTQNPAEAQRMAHRALHHLIQTTRSPSFNNNIRGLIEACNDICPFWLFNECIGADCCLSRINKNLELVSNHRDTFENMVKTELVKIIDTVNTGRPVYYVGFASGAIFSDFVLLVKTLKERPHASIVVTLVDRAYKIEHIMLFLLVLNK